MLQMNYQYNQVVLGGTFDLLHIGHQAILVKAFAIGQFVTIGLTTDKFNQSRGKPTFQNQNARLKNLKLFLEKEGYKKRYKIILINDIFGTTLSDPKLEAIIVSPKTKTVAHLINKKRVKIDLKQLRIVTVPYIKDQSRFNRDRAGGIISATRIRNGEISTVGQNYQDMLLKIAGKRLADDIRGKLKKPLGKIVAIKSLHQPVISVGDVTTQNLLKAKIKPILSVVDAKVGRKNILNTVNNCVKVKNPPGQISKALILAINQALHQPSTILVDGEEDLATIPAILLSPLGVTVFYGQPGIGLVEVKVDLEIKQYLCEMLKLH